LPLHCTNSEIIRFLTSKTTRAGVIDRLKIRYRPLICPFPDLLNLATNKTAAFDLGCGSGQFCALLAHYTDVRDIMGIEISETLIRNALELNCEFAHSKSMKFQYFDGKTIPDEIGNYDVVYMIDVFHHVDPSHQRPLLQQLHRKMSPASTLVFKDINGSSPLVVFNKVHDLIFSGEIGNEISDKAARKLLEETGFKVKDAFTRTTFVYPHYFVVCEKS
jgi:SAM-dependent methyltransferase